MGAVGKGISAFQKALEEGQNHFKLSKKYNELSFPVICAEWEKERSSLFAEFSVTQQSFLKKLSHSMPNTLLASITVTQEAWKQAKLAEFPVDPQRIGIIVTGQNNARHYQYLSQLSFEKIPEHLSPSYALHFMDTDQVGTLSHLYGILGEGFSVGGASASGNVALIRAFHQINQGLLDACIVVGALAELSPIELQAFHHVGALGGRNFSSQPHKACRPFDRAHEGFIYGQAAGCMILESISSAKKRNVDVQGYMLGGVSILDANRMANPSTQGELRAMQQALFSAGITVDEVDYINAHGTSTPAGDCTEIEAIEALLTSHAARVFINSTKSITGHCLWSAGVIEAIATLLQMKTGFIHPTLNLEQPINENCRLVGPQKESANIHMALSNSFGFGGINTSIVLKGV